MHAAAASDARLSAKRALITGITGQDGSYLAELLLDKGYEVFGVVRRSSTQPFERIRHIQEQVRLISGDLLDERSLVTALEEARPHEVYNLAAQSFVQTSFQQPVLTGEVTALGVTRILDAIRTVDPSIRFYQASSSEMFGNTPHSPQNEETPFFPRSPYGVAKVYGHWITRNYRESYGLFAVPGILFNHECVTAETPLIVRRNGLVDCLPIAELMPNTTHVRQRELNFDVWDRGRWTRARLGTATWNAAGRGGDKRVHRVLARCGEVRATADHELLRADASAVQAEKVIAGDDLLTTELPDPPGVTEMSCDMAWFLGLMAAEGYASYLEGRYEALVRNNDPILLERVGRLWQRLFGGTVSHAAGVSGFTGERTSGLNLLGSRAVCHWLYEALYARDGSKRVPLTVLNGNAETWRAFLSGYNAGDGLKAGHGKREFKNFKTSSPLLAAGLWWMASRVLNQKLTLNVDQVERHGVIYRYYSINLGTEGGPKKGRHLLKTAEEIKRIEQEDYTGWLYDIETRSGTFHAGVGNLVIHNSPRRGLEFVTRKISDGVARIKLGLASELRLGNLDAKRDWGWAPDYVRAMWTMLQQPAPRDYVVGTGEAHSVREFVEQAFAHVGLNASDFVKIDERFVRPAEVRQLVADARRARQELGWEPTVSFQKLVALMVDADLERLEREQARTRDAAVAARTRAATY